MGIVQRQIDKSLPSDPGIVVIQTSCNLGLRNCTIHTEKLHLSPSPHYQNSLPRKSQIMQNDNARDARATLPYMRYDWWADKPYLWEWRNQIEALMMNARRTKRTSGWLEERGSCLGHEIQVSSSGQVVRVKEKKECCNKSSLDRKAVRWISPSQLQPTYTTI